jgi:hypothetical protein
MDAIKRYDALRAAFGALSPADDAKAREALVTEKIIGFSENLKINSAVSVVRAFLEKLGEWERKEHDR